VAGVLASLIGLIVFSGRGYEWSASQVAAPVASLYGDPDAHVTEVRAYDGCEANDPTCYPWYDITLSGVFHHGPLVTRHIEFFGNAAIQHAVWDISGFNRRRKCGSTPLGFLHRCWYWFDYLPSRNCRQSIAHNAIGCIGPRVTNWADFLIYRDIPYQLWDASAGANPYGWEIDNPPAGFPLYAYPSTIRIGPIQRVRSGQPHHRVVAVVFSYRDVSQHLGLAYGLDVSGQGFDGSAIVSSTNGVELGCMPKWYPQGGWRRKRMVKSVVVDPILDLLAEAPLAFGFDYTKVATTLIVHDGKRTVRVPIVHHMFLFPLRAPRDLRVHAFDSRGRSLPTYISRDQDCGELA
jgi:hypothetical protein